MEDKWVGVIENLAKTGCSTREIATQVGCGQTTVMYWLNKLGLILPKKEKSSRFCYECKKKLVNHIGQNRGKYCNSKCQLDHQYHLYITKWLNDEESGTVGKYAVSAHVRRYLFEKSRNKCQRCGWNKKNRVTKNCPLEVHHKDGNSKNSTPNNVELICPNCHSLTKTYGSLNNGKGRKGRKGRY